MPGEARVRCGGSHWGNAWKLGQGVINTHFPTCFGDKCNGKCQQNLAPNGVAGGLGGGVRGQSRGKIPEGFTPSMLAFQLHSGSNGSSFATLVHGSDQEGQPVTIWGDGVTHVHSVFSEKLCFWLCWAQCTIKWVPLELEQEIGPGASQMS